MRPASWRWLGPPVAVGLAVALFAVAEGQARADEGDMVLDLGGATIDTRKVTHGVATLGSPASEVGHDKDEEPVRQISITRDFWIGKYPVTRGQFAKFVADTRYVSDAEKGQAGGAGWDGKQLTAKKDFTWRSPGFTQTDDHPVVLVSFGDASAFVGWASRKSGKRVRLPTEAEWEYAARGGTSTPWYGGSTEAEALTLGWFKPNAGNGTRPVGQKKPNPLGIFDMAGNVYEWCRDVYGPYRETAIVDPEAAVNTGPEAERRVLRGGSWLRDPKRGRSAARHRNTPGVRNADNGFRIVVTNEETVAPGATGAGVDFAPAAPLGASGGAGSSGSTSSGPGVGPLADGQAIHVEPIERPSEPFSWGLLLASPLAAASAVVAWMLLRGKRPARPAAPPVPARAPAPAVRAANPAGVSTRVSTDGFFVRAANAPPGSRIRYACIVNGAEVADVVPLDGAAETFIYTGSPPTAIRVVEVLPGARPVAVEPPRAPPPLPVRPPPVPAPEDAANPFLVPFVDAAPSSGKIVPAAPSSSASLPVSSPLPPSSRPVLPGPPSSRPDLPPPSSLSELPGPAPSSRRELPAPPPSSLSELPGPASSARPIPPAPLSSQPIAPAPLSSRAIPPAPASSRPALPGAASSRQSRPPSAMPRPSTAPSPLLVPALPPSSPSPSVPSPPASSPSPPAAPASSPLLPSPAPPASSPSVASPAPPASSPSAPSAPSPASPPPPASSPLVPSPPASSPSPAAPSAPSTPPSPPAPAQSPSSSPAPSDEGFAGHPRAY